MLSIPEALERFKRLTTALRKELDAFLSAFSAVLPDARHRQALHLLVPAMLAARSPHPVTAAAHAPDPTANPWALAKRFLTLLHTPRFSHQRWLQVFYTHSAAQVATLPARQRLIVALDPMNLEKPYARKLEGICKVYKETPPGTPLPQKPRRLGQGRLRPKARITWGYPAIFALALNTPQPALLYHRLFSYKTADFRSQPWEWMEGMRQLRTLAGPRRVCLVADAEADDQKLWHAAAENHLELIARATKERIIEVWKPRQHAWETAKLQAHAARLSGRGKRSSVFTHAGRTIPVQVTLDWFPFRLPDRSWEGWAVVARTSPQQEPPRDFWLPPLEMVLITQRPVRCLRQAWGVYRDWAQRGRIEPFYRFLQEDGLDVEAILLRRLEPFRRMVLVVLLAAFFVLQLAGWWSPLLIQWIRSIASAVVGTAMDRRGPYLLLHGIQCLLSTVALLEEVRIRPPPLRKLSKKCPYELSC